jgi:hypothetical protein
MALQLIHACEAGNCKRTVSAKDVVIVALTLRGPAGVIDISAECCGAHCAAYVIKKSLSDYAAVNPKREEGELFQ